MRLILEIWWYEFLFFARYTQDIIRKAPNNESPWNYLRGIMLDDEMRKYPQVADFCQELYDAHIRSPYLLAFMVDLVEEELQLGATDAGTKLERAQEVGMSTVFSLLKVPPEINARFSILPPPKCPYINDHNYVSEKKVWVKSWRCSCLVT